MRSTEIRELLRKRFPDDRYITVDEAPIGADRGGRRLDFLAIALWKSRGLQLDGIEIKVSLGDWRRELKEGAKAEFWWRHTHRFWVAVPKDLVSAVRPELPDTWGLISCTDARTKIERRATVREAEPLEWPTIVGLLRASADFGFNARNRAVSEGYDAGLVRGREESATTPAAVSSELEALRKMMNEFEEASGLSIARWDARRVGGIVALIEEAERNPAAFLERIATSARGIGDQAKGLVRKAEEAEALARKIFEAVGGSERKGGD